MGLLRLVESQRLRSQDPPVDSIKTLKMTMMRMVYILSELSIHLSVQPWWAVTPKVYPSKGRAGPSDNYEDEDLPYPRDRMRSLPPDATMQGCRAPGSRLSGGNIIDITNANLLAFGKTMS